MASSRKAQVLLSVAAALVAAAVGCQLLVDLDGLDDGHCGQNEKACPGGYCVPKGNPNTSCSDNGCAPCALPHARATCGQSGHCVVLGCVGAWQNCDTIDDNGCEIDVAHDPKHCGDCMTEPCAKPPFGSAGCSEGHCAIGSCFQGHEDCDHEVDGGCEREIGTDSNCLTCDIACPPDTHCHEGVCK